MNINVDIFRDKDTFDLLPSVMIGLEDGRLYLSASWFEWCILIN